MKAHHAIAKPERFDLQDPGKLKIQPDGFYFKSSKSGKAFHVNEAELDVVEWMRVARGHEVKIFTKDGNVTKFAGFKESVSGPVTH